MCQMKMVFLSTTPVTSRMESFSNCSFTDLHTDGFQMVFLSMRDQLGKILAPAAYEQNFNTFIGLTKMTVKHTLLRASTPCFFPGYTPPQ